jgi:NADH pyrophosphatase NudC (nudix superfamily)
MKHCGQCGALLEEAGDASGHPHKRCPACGWRWYDPPVPVVLVLLTTDDGRVVYTRKDNFEPWRWTVVAGFVERGERAEDAALREVREETNLEAEIVRFMGTHFLPGRTDQLVIAFHARVTGGEPRPGSDVDAIDIAPPDPSRLREGATSQLLVRRYLEEQTATATAKADSSV